MTQIVITLKDQSYLPNIRRIVKSLQGVERVSVTRQKESEATAKARMSGARSSKGFLKGLSVPADTTSRQLVDDYLEEKYGA